MANLSQHKRHRMLEFLQKIRDEHKDDDNVLIALGEIENELNSKKYGLVWEQHEEAVDVKMRTHVPVFTEDKEREISAVPGKNYNFLLEGDNLHSLRLIEKTHKGKIDVIYIDPPYNTGNKDFVYDDVCVDKTDSFAHSKWLSFMSERLKIAHDVLSDKGVLFISIDDNEQAPLKMLCDEIFGEENFIQNYIWECNFKPDNSSPLIRPNAENILCYLRNRTKDSKFKKFGAKTTGLASLTKDTEKVKTIVFPKNTVKTTLSNGKYSKGRYANDGWILEKDIEVKDGIIIDEVILTGKSYWATSKKIESEISAGTEIWIKSKKFIPYYKKQNSGQVIPTTILPRELINDYQTSKNELKNIFNQSLLFDNPKPISLIKFLLSMIDYKNITVLDFFAGSGTTAQAVIELNSEDDGNRKFILCTNNENNICENVTYPRIKTVITGSRQDGTRYSDGLPANLKYYRTDFVSKEEDDLPEALLNHIAEMIQLEHGIKLDGKDYIMILDDDEADRLALHWSEYSCVKALYVSKNVLFTTEQNALFKDVEMHVIPDYYFNFELREVCESW